MNFVLRRAGGKGTQSRAARSFLQYGKKLDGPRVGAIAIMYRKGPNNGHVGVVRGTDGQGNPIIVSGNHGNTVRQSVYSKSRVLAYVMPPQYVLDDMAPAARAPRRRPPSKRASTRVISAAASRAGALCVSRKVLHRASKLNARATLARRGLMLTRSYPRNTATTR